MRPDLRPAAAAAVLLVACDYDGTLAPIVDDPAIAYPDRDATSVLADLAALSDTHVAIISGRGRSELERLVGPLPGARLIGGHGADWGSTPTTPDAGEIARRLQSVADQFPGAIVERKATGAALHVRQVEAAQADRAVKLAVDAAGELATRVVRGKRVVEFSTSGADKGSAIRRLRDELSPDVTVFIGDDVTDEDAFVALGTADIGIKVGTGDTAASWRVADQSEVAPLLDALTAMRSR